MGIGKEGGGGVQGRCNAKGMPGVKGDGGRWLDMYDDPHRPQNPNAGRERLGRGGKPVPLLGFFWSLRVTAGERDCAWQKSKGSDGGWEGREPEGRGAGNWRGRGHPFPCEARGFLVKYDRVAVGGRSKAVSCLVFPLVDFLPLLASGSPLATTRAAWGRGWRASRKPLRLFII